MWREITSDPNILQYVQGVKISFIEGIVPRQQTYRPSVFNGQQHKIVQNEIQRQLLKGVLWDMGVCIDHIFTPEEWWVFSYDPQS